MELMNRSANIIGNSQMGGQMLRQLDKMENRTG
jgi:hypothetical protein